MIPATDYPAWQFWAFIFGQLFNVFAWVSGWVILRKKATASEIGEIKTALQGMKVSQAKNCGTHQARTSTLEERAKNAPTHTDIGAVHDRITGVKGSVDELSGLIKGMSGNVRLLVEHHLRGDGK